MSGPIDTDTFVTSDLDSGIDVTTLDPIQEEEDAVRNDEESVLQQDSLENIHANVQEDPTNNVPRRILAKSSSFIIFSIALYIN
jgi:Fe-S cluster assembly ATPase SufC